MNGNKFADVIPFPDFNPRRFAAVFQILRREPDGNERKDFIVVADNRFTVNNDVRFEPDIFAQNDFIADDRIRILNVSERLKHKTKAEIS